MLAACASSPKTFSRPAPTPATALACALRAATDSGFTPVRGGIADGYIVVDRPRGWSKGDVASEAATRYLTLGIKGSGRTVGDELTITGAAGSLRVTAAGIDKGGKPVGPSDRGEASAHYVLDACAAR
jgi:hypothetical protein